MQVAVLLHHPMTTHPATAATTIDLAADSAEATFVAINYITCTPDYRERFEMLFGSRAHAIDCMPGFRHMQVLRPAEAADAYLIVSHWADEAAFKAWTGSPEFLEGHKRGFDDVRLAREQGLAPPMTSSFKTYTIFAR
jgi:heme oxygenase (mycobilin-producing)